MSRERALRPRESVRVVASVIELVRAAEALVLAHARGALAEREAFHFVLSGGSTPRELYRALALADADAAFERWHAWFGDERCVPPDHEGSNYFMAAQTGFLARLPAAHVHRLRGEAADARAEAARYERELVAQVGLPPRLDLVLLGLGPDGHTASLFPGTSALDAGGWMTVGEAPKPPTRRLSLTFAAFERARAIVFLVAGSDKREALAAALDPAIVPPVPARRAHPRDGTLTWLVERSAEA